MVRLVLHGNKGSTVEDEKIIFDVHEGHLRMRKFKRKVVIDWTTFTCTEVKKIFVFLALQLVRRLACKKGC